MPDITTIHDLLSGKSKGIWPSLVRSSLRCLEPVYSLGANWKNRKFDKQPDLAKKIPAAVISVGNITTGGTGKTPVIALLAKFLLNKQLNVGIVSRGYKAQPNELNDEGKELQLYLPHVPHIQNQDRVYAANAMVDEHHVDVILLDDGFQHRRLYRDLDLVLIDATNPFGYDHLLPRGLLREPLSGLKRADLILLTRTDQVAEQSLEQTINTIVHHNCDAIIAQSTQRPLRLVDKHGTNFAIDELQNCSVVAFCGIGNPRAFNKTLRDIGIGIRKFLPFPDHHQFTMDDLKQITNTAAQTEAAAMICTVKDLVKLQTVHDFPDKLYALQIQTEITSGEPQLKSAIFDLINTRPDLHT